MNSKEMNYNDKKIALNKKKGIFSLSKKAYEKLELEWDGKGFFYTDREIATRTSKKLIDVIEELGSESWGPHAKLIIKKIPSKGEYFIFEENGIEYLSKKA